MKKALLLHILLWTTGQCFGQFYPQQSLYMYNTLPMNAAAAGKDNAMSITLGHRDMWRGVQGAPATQYFCVHSPLRNERIALGLQVLNDKIGVTKRTGLMASGSYRLHLSEHSRLAFALTSAMVSVSNRWSEINTTQPGDQTFTAGDQAYWLPNVGAGIFYHDKNSFAGISIPYFLTETYRGGGVYKATHQMRNYTYHLMGGSKLFISEKAYIKPAALLKYHAGSTWQADLTALAGIKKMGELGITYRHQQALVALANYQVNEQLNITYGFDYAFRRWRVFDRGTHEIAVSYTFLYHNNSPDTRFF